MNAVTFAVILAASWAQSSAVALRGKKGIACNGRGRGSSLISTQPFQAFLAIPTTGWKSKGMTLNAGWGRTEHYTWNEDNKYVYVTAVLEHTVLADDLDIKIESDALYAISKKKPLIPLVSGKTKGAVDVDGSFWTLEENSGLRELQITLKKAEKDSGHWYGVVKNEVVQQQTYDTVTRQDSVTKAQSLEPKGVFWRKLFPTVDAEQLSEMLKRWMARESTELIPFGKPKLPITIAFLPADEGGKLVYESNCADVDEYMDVIVNPVVTDDTKYSGGGSEIIFINSPTTRVISGELGMEQADKVKTAINTLIQSFERDVHRLDGLMKHKQEESDKFDYMGSSAFLDAENLESYVNYHEELKKMSPAGRRESDPKKVFKDEETGVTIDWNPTDDGPDVSEEENENKKKMLINQLTEAVKHTKKTQPEETVKSLITNVRQKLALNDVEYDQMMLNAKDRINKECDLLTQKQKLFSQLKSVAAVEESYPSEEEIAGMGSQPPEKDTFDIAMEFPERSMLAKKYKTISSVQKEQLRRRWKSNEKRLKLLITELLQSTPQKCPTLCNDYRDLLISEDYPTLMRSYLCFNKVESKHEKERLGFLNEFVLSLYKDQQIYLLHDENIQLQKIQQIIDWARKDYEDINDLIMKNKHQYDKNFMCYLNLAISKEVEQIREEEGMESLESGVTNPQLHPWLCILTIIHRAINSIIRADMAEDLFLIGSIVSFDNPKVRSYMLEFILATMPRSDWKAFKDLILSASNSLINRPLEERTDLAGTEPHFVEAVMQMRDEVEKMIPDWIIDEMLSEDDKRFMVENNRKKIPVLQLDLEPRQGSEPATQSPEVGEIPIKTDSKLPYIPA